MPTVLRIDGFRFFFFSDEHLPIETIKANGYNLDIKNPHKEEVEHTYTSSELLKMLSNSFAKSNTLLEKLKSELS